MLLLGLSLPSRLFREFEPHHHVSAGREELIGKTAEVKMAMNPKGTVLIEDKLWTAISEDCKAKPGDEVIITKVDRLKLWVTNSKEVNRCVRMWRGFSIYYLERHRHSSL